jgi:hypothetical protein
MLCLQAVHRFQKLLTACIRDDIIVVDRSACPSKRSFVTVFEVRLGLICSKIKWVESLSGGFLLFRYRLEQMVAEAVEAERSARAQRLRRQDLGPLSAELLKGLGNYAYQQREDKERGTCLTMGQLARQCFERGESEQQRR